LNELDILRELSDKLLKIIFCKVLTFSFYSAKYYQFKPWTEKVLSVKKIKIIFEKEKDNYD
jgi:hypothetical protein